MGLFKGRPLALICFTYILALFIAISLTTDFQMIILMGILIIGVLLAVIYLIIKHTNKRKFLLIGLLLLALFLGIFRTYFSITKKQADALDYTGRRTVTFTVISREYASDNCSEYTVNLSGVGEKETNIRALIVFAFPAELHEGDSAVARAELISPTEKIWGFSARERTDDIEILLAGIIYDSEDCAVFDCAKGVSGLELLSRDCGFEIVMSRFKENVGSYFDNILGEEISPLAKGIFMGDKSDISYGIIRDFRRSGVSHLLAVSGLHISVLLGAVERLLKRLYVDKKIRCIIIAILGVVLVAVTGFSSSACRAVIMLLIAYFHYFAADDEDSVTSLFVAIGVILLASPYSVYDLGLWMSFLATLGIVSVFPAMEEKIPYVDTKNAILKRLQKIGRAVLSLALITFIANLFLIPVYWRIFGEISLLSIPANLLISPLATVYLCLIPFALAFGRINVISDIIFAFMKLTQNALIKTAELFSRSDYAVQRFTYRFADIVIIALIAVTSVLLLIRLRRKWLILAPPLLAIVAFIICLNITYVKEPSEVIYMTDGTQEMIVAVDNGKSVVCDVSAKSYKMYGRAFDTVQMLGANKIDTLILTHYDDAHLQIIKGIESTAVIDEVYLPSPLSHFENDAVYELIEIFEKKGIRIYFYDGNSPIKAENNIKLYIQRNSDSNPEFVSVFFEKDSLTYCNIGSQFSEKGIEEIVFNSRYLLIRSCGVEIDAADKGYEKIIFTESDSFAKSRITLGEAPFYVNDGEEKDFSVSFKLE